MNLILNFLLNNTKLFKYLGAFALVAGLGYGAKHSFYVWHVEPMEKIKKELKTANKDLSTSRAELTLCESAKKNEVFEVKHETVFDAFRKKKKEMENEKELNTSASYGDDYSWMYR